MALAKDDIGGIITIAPLGGGLHIVNKSACRGMRFIRKHPHNHFSVDDGGAQFFGDVVSLGKIVLSREWLLSFIRVATQQQ